jgi:hypothetical protein
MHIGIYLSAIYFQNYLNVDPKECNKKRPFWVVQNVKRITRHKVQITAFDSSKKNRIFDETG